VPASSGQEDGYNLCGAEVSLAGRVSIKANGVLIDEERLPGRQGRLVFAYLASENGRAVTRDELAEALWGEEPPPTWEKALGVIASKLRALLAECGIDGAKALSSAFGCYRLDLPAGSRVDVVAAAGSLAEAEAALAAGDSDTARAAASLAASLVREPLLPGEDAVWVEGKRRELTDLHVQALDCLADACLRSGDPSDSARWAQEAIELEPFRESGYRRLMKAHAAAGNRGQALRTYERCRRFLADELGAYPSPETDLVYRELLATTPGHEGPTIHADPFPAALTRQNAEPVPSEARKTLTMLFADLAGWMEMVERLDAEAADQLATRYYRETQRVVLRHGGIIEKSAGGVITAAFGFPVAHEDDALRAVRAALELSGAVSVLNEEIQGGEGSSLALKVAVNTGDVFVGIEGTHGPRFAGDVVAIAARLEEEAVQPGEILIGSATRNLIRGVVEAEALGSVALAGRAEPVEVWRVLGLVERSAPARAATAPFVGRGPTARESPTGHSPRC